LQFGNKESKVLRNPLRERERERERERGASESASGGEEKEENMGI